MSRRQLTSLRGKSLPIPDNSRLVHLQLRRFAGCPICSLHLRGFARRHDELVQAGIVEIAVLHSTAEELRKVHADQPFAVVPDPERLLYAELGLRTSLRAVLHPRVWAAGTRALLTSSSKNPSAGRGDGALGLPGDFLIAPSGHLVALHRGAHADDQWSVDQVLALGRRHRNGS